MEKVKFSIIYSLAFIFVVAIFSSGLFVYQVKATTQQKLTASDPGSSDRFGDVVDVSGNYAIVGSALDDDNGKDSGSAYVYYWTGFSWKQIAKLSASDGVEGDKFGTSVAISGNTIVVGAPTKDSRYGQNAGAIYVFTKNNNDKWEQTQELISKKLSANDNFGYSVDVAGNYIVAGAYLDDDKSPDAGAIYVFSKSLTSWTEQTKLLSSDGSWGDNFGFSVAISGTTLVAGAPNHTKTGYDDWGWTTTPNSGSAYVFSLNNNLWQQTANLSASDASNYAVFGYSVDISGNNLVVGAIGDSQRGSQAGATYIFAKNRIGNWSESQKLTIPGRLSYINYGFDVSLSGNNLVVSSVYKSSSYLQTGAVYLYSNVYGTWSNNTEFVTDSSYPDAFGSSVSLGSNGVLVGTPQDLYKEQFYYGSVYYYSF